MPLILGTNSIKDTGYDVANSLRFNDGSSDNLSRSTASGTDTVWTWSGWLKRSHLGTSQTFFGTGNGSSSANSLQIRFDDSNRLDYRNFVSDAYNGRLQTNALFRDVSAWYHFVFVWDTTQGTAGNRMKVYINGVQETSFADERDATQNSSAHTSGSTTFLGTDGYGGNTFFDGYLAEVVFIDGTALDPTSFGEFDEDTGIWKPIDVSGLTFGTNGFYLDFENSGSLGADVSGNGNNFTVNNLTAIDQSTDTCTNNFATMNPLDLGATTGGEFLQGNLDVHMGGTAQGVYYSTIGVSTGKWYVEVNPDSGSGGNSYIGISGNANNSRGANDLLGDLAFDYGYYQSDGSLRNNDSDSSYGSSYSNGNIIGVYLDLDNNKLYFSVNGTVQNSGTGISISAVTNTPTGNYFFCVGDDNAFAERRFNLNFGSPIESISSSNTDDNGYGNFEYSPNITGDSVAKKFYSLNTKNLAEYG